MTAKRIVAYPRNLHNLPREFLLRRRRMSGVRHIASGWACSEAALIAWPRCCLPLSCSPEAREVSATAAACCRLLFKVLYNIFMEQWYDISAPQQPGVVVVRTLLEQVIPGPAYQPEQDTAARMSCCSPSVPDCTGQRWVGSYRCNKPLLNRPLAMQLGYLPLPLPHLTPTLLTGCTWVRCLTTGSERQLRGVLRSCAGRLSARHTIGAGACEGHMPGVRVRCSVCSRRPS